MAIRERDLEGMDLVGSQTDGDAIEEFAEPLFDRVLAFLFDPAVVGVVRSSSASEADVDDAELMLYYASHPETELNESLTESV